MDYPIGDYPLGAFVLVALIMAFLYWMSTWGDDDDWRFTP